VIHAVFTIYMFLDIYIDLVFGIGGIGGVALEALIKNLMLNLSHHSSAERKSSRILQNACSPIPCFILSTRLQCPLRLQR
jgi:hypothetical protein